MNNKQIATALRKILANEDVESDSVITRKRSAKHQNELEVLLDHVSLLVTYLRFDAKATRRELFSIRRVMEG